MKNLLHRAECLRQAFIFSPFERSLIWHKVAGYDAIMLATDAPMYGIRLNEGRNNLGIPDGIEYPNLAPGMDMSSLVKEEDPLAYGKMI